MLFNFDQRQEGKFLDLQDITGYQGIGENLGMIITFFFANIISAANATVPHGNTRDNWWKMVEKRVNLVI